MANVKINDLVAIGSVVAGTQFETDTSGTTSNKATGAQIKAFVEDGLAVSNSTGVLNARIDNVQALSANYSVIDADNNKLFLITTSTNDIIITLPNPTTTILGTRVGFLKVDNTLGLVKFTKTPAVFWELPLQNDFIELVNTGVDWAIVSFGNYFINKSVKHFFHDFANANSQEIGGNLIVVATGTGTALTGLNATTGLSGVGTFSTGTTATGYVSSFLQTNANTGAFIQNGSFIGHNKSYISVPTLSTTLEEFDVFVGFMLAALSSAPSQGAYFQYDTNQSNNWLCVTANSSVRTTVDSGVPVSTAYTKLEVRLSSAEARYYIDDVFITSILTNLPLGVFTIGMMLFKSVGIVSRTMRLDWMATDINLGNLNRGI
jgi:hypothetical protein